MSFFDTSGMIPVQAPELIAVPTQPATAPVAQAQGAGAEDSTSSSSGSLVEDPETAVDVVELNSSGPTGRGNSASPSQQAQAAATLVDINGASSVTVEDYQLSVPPNLATATELVSQLAATVNRGAAEMGAAYQLLSHDTALALTSG